MPHPLEIKTFYSIDKTRQGTCPDIRDPMKAVVQKDYGTPDVFALRDVSIPQPNDDEVRVRVHAAGLHAGDVLTMRGVPYLVRLFAGWPRPKGYIPGFDAAGRVDAVGKNVTRLQPGDEVYGAGEGCCAGYVCISEKTLLPKPTNLTMKQAAAVPTSGLTALVALRDAGKVQPGQRVLINGASGGVGTFAVQIAKAFGAEVTGVCSSPKMDLVRFLGADHVIDYTRENFTRTGEQYDLILDHGANHNLSDCWRALTPKGVHLPNSGLGGLGFVLKAMAASLFVNKQGRPFIVKPNHEDMKALNALVESGKTAPVIDRTYPLAETPSAFRYLDAGLARGKVVIIMD
jgi:NADPH:quinone reductase-like Zn-dependent oxidoreductase